MAKYTTEVRSILSALNGLDEEPEYEDIEDNISNGWNKIFDSASYSQFVYSIELPTQGGNWTFNYEYGRTICMNILREYYTREIGAETFGIWKLWMNNRLRENADYIKQIFEGKLDIIYHQHTEPIVKYIKKYKDGSRDIDEYGGKNSSGNLSSNSSIDHTSSVDYDSSDTYSQNYKNLDTPQGNDFALLDGYDSNNDDVIDKLYGTQGSRTTGSGNDTHDSSRDLDSSNATSNNFTRSLADNATDDRTNTRTIVEYDLSGKLPNEVVDDVAEAMFNVTEEIVDMFSDLFMRVY